MTWVLLGLFLLSMLRIFRRWAVEDAGADQGCGDIQAISVGARPPCTVNVRVTPGRRVGPHPAALPGPILNLPVRDELGLWEPWQHPLASPLILIEMLTEKRK
jgi:hypothetical protein